MGVNISIEHKLFFKTIFKGNVFLDFSSKLFYFRENATVKLGLNNLQ